MHDCPANPLMLVLNSATMARKILQTCALKNARESSVGS